MNDFLNKIAGLMHWERFGYHLIGGLGIGVYTLFWYNSGCFTAVRIHVGIAVTVAIIVKEIFEDRVTQTRFKTIMDCIAWPLGYVILVVWF